MLTIEEHYKILGFENLTILPTEKEVKKRYRKLALKYHPDQSNNCDLTAFNNIVKSYEKICEKNNK